MTNVNAATAGGLQPYLDMGNNVLMPLTGIGSAVVGKLVKGDTPGEVVTCTLALTDYAVAVAMPAGTAILAVYADNNATIAMGEATSTTVGIGVSAGLTQFSVTVTGANVDDKPHVQSAVAGAKVRFSYLAGLAFNSRPQGQHFLQSFVANVGVGGSFDPAVTLAAGAPTPVWTVTGDAGTAVYTTPAITHIQSGAGNLRVSLGPANILPYITSINMDVDGLLGTFTAADLARLPALTSLSFYNNPTFSCRFSLSALSAAMTSIQLSSSFASVITGTLSDLKAAMTFLALSSTASVITGTLSDLKAAMTFLALNSTASVITGGSLAIVARGLLTLNLASSSMSQADVDGIVLGRLYADRALFTAAAPILTIGGTNAAPSGVYQSVTPPTTGKEAIYDLVNDPTAAGFHKWTSTYTA